jgi:hypothetical protein
MENGEWRMSWRRIHLTVKIISKIVGIKKNVIIFAAILMFFLIEVE